MNAFIVKMWRWWLVLLAFLVVVAAYIWVSTLALPAMVASGFDNAGNVRDSMTRESYRNLVLAIATLVPLAIAAFMSVLGHLEPDVARVPNREYWLRPENRAAMYVFLARWAFVVAIGFCIFVCAVHASVVQANALQPPRLIGTSDLLGHVFKGFTLTMIVVVVNYFFRTGAKNSRTGGHLQPKVPQKPRRS